MQDQVAHLRERVNVDGRPAVDEAFAGDGAEGGGLDELEKYERAYIFEIELEICRKQVLAACGTDLIGLVGGIIAVSVEEGIEVLAKGRGRRRAAAVAEESTHGSSVGVLEHLCAPAA